MPTVGWIQETVIDRYWERGALRDQYPLPRKSYDCPYCTRQFQSTAELSTHISVDHPIERPLIFIRNRVAHSEQIIRSPISKDDIAFTHVNKIRLSRNGGEIKECSLDELKTQLSSKTNGHYSITLINGDPDNERIVEANYIVRIKIADPAELDGVDAHFIQTLAVDDIRMSDVRRFSDTCERYSRADEYASALAVYVMGVLIKDQNKNSGISQPWSTYKEKMQKAFDTLCDFDRPVSWAICGSIKFNLNDFKNPPLPSGALLLDAGNAFFSDLAGGRTTALPRSEPMKPRSRENPACPIDRDAYELLCTLRKVQGGNVDRSLIAELSVAAISRQMSDYDLSKLRVLTAVMASQIGDAAVAGRVLQNLANDPVFGDWAESQLERWK